MDGPNYYVPADRHRLAYRKQPPRPGMEGRAGVVFMGGFRSDMTGTKAMHLEEWARHRGREFLRFDYSGHGASDGRFEDLCLSEWIADAEDMVRFFTQGPQIVVGSSMGGWVGLSVALRRPMQVKGFVGIAAAPDFTEDMMWACFSDAVKAEIETTGRHAQPSDYSDEPYVITKRLIEDGRRHLLLRKPLPLTIPVTLLQGMQDTDVPWQRAIKIAETLTAADVRIHLSKAGDHRLSEPDDLDLLTATLDTMTDKIDRSLGM